MTKSLIGQTISHFRVTEKLGQGGMGEVYRATDTKLNREVAIKRLPETLANDGQLMARFQREARVLASLNHPNIAVIYGVEESKGRKTLVMELVEGEDLSARIAAGPIPPEEALPIALQVAEALEEAHEKGIIHRDLKPANIRITVDGRVKVLDFGLAKVLEGDPSPDETNLSRSPTLMASQAGVLLGTVPYMSPEQAGGKPVDKRTDIWAFGVVLFEMLAGQRTFAGKDASLTLANVLTKAPDWEKLPEKLPGKIRRLLERCLRKDPKSRLRDIGDARISIEECLAEPDQSKEARPMDWVSAKSRIAFWAVLSLAVIAAASFATLYFGRAEDDAATVRFLINSPPELSFRRGDTPLVSPDGMSVILEGTDENGQFHLWLRRMDSLVTQKLKGTKGAFDAFWSPDSQSIGFFAGSKLKTIGVSSGLTQTTVADVGDGWGGTWGRNGIILFSSAPSGPIFQVPSAGGQPVPVTQLDSPPAESHDFPKFLPDGRRFLFTARAGEQSGIYVGSMESGQAQLVVRNSGNPSISNGHLLFPQESAQSSPTSSGLLLMAQPFDSGEAKLIGEPFPIAEDVSTWLRRSSYSASDTGVLVYRSGSGRSGLTWRDRKGKKLASVGKPGTYSQVALSPDEKRVVVEADGDIWLLELATDALSRFTLEPSIEGDAVWSPDGSRILYQSEGQTVANLFQKPLGGGEAELVFESSEAHYPEDWSSDGRMVIFVSGGARAVYSLDLTRADRTPQLLLESSFQKDEYRLSPDRKWIAYNSNESGRVEVYVASFPEFGQRRQVSNAGGSQALWRKDGKELFYLQLDGKLMSVKLADGSGLNPSAPDFLFQTTLTPNPLWNQYGVTADGQRFLFLEPLEADQINVVMNWLPAPQ